MGYNWALHAATMANLASISASNSLHRLDIQNAFKYANAMLPERKSNKPLSNKLADEFEFHVMNILDWADILGDGFTRLRPEKLQKYLELYSGKKYYKLQKFILKTYDDQDDMSDKELKEWAKDLLDALADFTTIAKNTWEAGQEKELTRLDSQYYDYAKEEFDKMLDKYRE